MISWEAAAAVVLGVMMRKSICRFQEIGEMAMEFVSVFVSAVRFSGLLFRRPVQVQTGPGGRYSHLSPMVARHDRFWRYQVL